MKRFGKALVNVVLWPVSSDAVVQGVAVVVVVASAVIIAMALFK